MPIQSQQDPEDLEGAVTRAQTISEATAKASGPGGTEGGARTLAERLAAKQGVAKRTGRG